MKVKDKDNLTDAEKKAIWEERWKSVDTKPVSRKRTEAELINDEKVWRP